MSLSDDDYLSVMFRVETLGQTYAQAGMALGASRSAISGIVKRMRDAKDLVDACRLSDNEVKLVLDRHFFGRTRAEVIAKDFAGMGKPLTRHAVLYLVWWVMNDLCAAGDDLTRSADNAEVIDWPLWWRRVQTREVAA